MTIFGITISMMVFWLSMAILFLIIEAMTTGLTTIWFAIGAVASLVVSIAGGNTIVQTVVFFFVSIVLLYFTKTIFKNKLHIGNIMTNVDALIGENAIVTKDIEPFKTGTIKLKGQEWTAIASDNKVIIKEGETVVVKRIEGVKAVVDIFI